MKASGDAQSSALPIAGGMWGRVVQDKYTLFCRQKATIMEKEITVDLCEDFRLLPQFQLKHARICSEAFAIKFQKCFKALLSLLFV